MLLGQDPQPKKDVAKRASLSVDEAVTRLSKGRENAGKTASPPEQQPDGIDPEVTTLAESEESDAGGSPGDDAAEAAADASADEDGDAKDPLVAVTINGEEVEVPLSELIAGYSRHGDYTKKTQALAEQRRAVEQQANDIQALHAELTAERAKMQTARAAYEEGLTAFDRAIGTADQEWAKVDWDQLEDEDPVQAQKLWRQYQQHKERKTMAEAEAKRLKEERAEEARREHQEAASRFRAVVREALPEWGNEEVRTKDWAAMHKLAKSLKFTDEEINATTDPRIFLLLHKAMKGDRIQAVKASATNPASTRSGHEAGQQPAKVIPPSGARPVVRAGNSGASTNVREALAKFRATRTIESAASLLASRRTAQARATRRS